jgi:ribosome-binding protein aMBF1 (putative translation factor)
MSLSVNTSAPCSHRGSLSKQAATAVDFPQRLAELRKRHSLTQAQLAERIGMHGEKRVVRSLLECMILKHEARRWQNVSTNGGERE